MIQMISLIKRFLIQMTLFNNNNFLIPMIHLTTHSNFLIPMILLITHSNFLIPMILLITHSNFLIPMILLITHSNLISTIPLKLINFMIHIMILVKNLILMNLMNSTNLINLNKDLNLTSKIWNKIKMMRFLFHQKVKGKTKQLVQWDLKIYV